MTPDLTKLRVFGWKVVTRNTGRHNTKLSKHFSLSLFFFFSLRYAKTIQIIVYVDTKTQGDKTTTYRTQNLMRLIFLMKISHQAQRY